MADTQTASTASTATETEAAPALTDFQRLMTGKQGVFGESNDHVKKAVESATVTLATIALQGAKVVPDNAIKTIEGIIAEIDKRLTKQVNQILHHPDFQKLEGSWRGLQHLVYNTQSDENLKIRVLNVTKKEIVKSAETYSESAWDQSPLFRKIYTEEYDQPGAAPYGCLIGDYTFDHSGQDVAVLSSLAQIAGAAHAPFFAAAAPSLLNMKSWEELGKPRDLTKLFQSAEYAPWRALRESEDARYLGLTMPRFLGRVPYGAKTKPVDDFAFEEETDGTDHDKYLWSNSAYAMAANITKSFKETGWCARIRGPQSGGMVEKLPTHTFATDDGGVDMKCPTEVPVTERRGAELEKNGLIPLSHWKNTNYAVFISAQSLHQPAVYDDPDATANANLGARLPYLFATCRFAHYLKCIVRDKLGSFKERSDMERWLNNWIINYVLPNPGTASEPDKAERPLAAAEVVVEEIPGNPGYYQSRFYLRPHYQLEGLTVSLRLVSKLPSAKKG